MVVIKYLKFSNMFSFGTTPITINIDSKVTQLVGPNGVGKSSIPAILEDLFFNKTSRGVKKSELVNRNSGAKLYTSEAGFVIGNDYYVIKKSTTSTTTLTLLKNGEDVSGHTATQTYQLVSNLLNMDFQTFTKLINQSMLSSLDFLTATDANRKKFLISLLGLEAYQDAQEELKKALSVQKAETARHEGQVSTLTAYVSSNEKLAEIEMYTPVPDSEEHLLVPKIDELKRELTLAEANKDRVAKERAKIVKLETLKKLDVHETIDVSNDLSTIKTSIANTLAKANLLVKEIKSLKEKPLECPTCKREYEDVHKEHVLQAIDSKTAEYNKYKTDLTELRNQEAALESDAKRHQASVQLKTDIQRAEADIDHSIANQTITSTDHTKELLRNLEEMLEANKKAIQEAEAHNRKVELSNAKIAQQKEQLAKFKADLASAITSKAVSKNKQDVLDTLVLATGTKGLIAYKIETMVKVFESLLNQYLQVLSDGRFVLTFEMDEAKLAIKLYDSGEEVGIASLSSGEYNRVNTATLLAVRKMLSSLSKVNINILFLDEVVSVLDQHGKDILIELLLSEPDLNSFVVSHGYVHPLADKIELEKVGTFSRIVE